MEAWEKWRRNYHFLSAFVTGLTSFGFHTTLSQMRPEILSDLPITQRVNTLDWVCSRVQDFSMWPCFFSFYLQVLWVSKTRSLGDLVLGDLGWLRYQLITYVLFALSNHTFQISICSRRKWKGSLFLTSLSDPTLILGRTKRIAANMKESNISRLRRLCQRKR